MASEISSLAFVHVDVHKGNDLGAVVTEIGRTFFTVPPTVDERVGLDMFDSVRLENKFSLQYALTFQTGRGCNIDEITI